MGDEFSLEDALIILQRRFLYFLIPVLAIIPLGILTVMLLPAKYTAKGTILVESQQIPTDLVRSTINSYAQERIQTIRQRVMTRNRLLEVADDYKLFPRSLGLSESERVDLMRERLRVDLITTSLSRTSGGRDGTIAFTVSYKDQDPDKAYLVANRFMTLFLDEDVRARTAGASNTTEFFVREATRLREAVSDLENKISEYKTKNADALPEHLNMHLDMLERSRQELSTAQASIAQLEQEKRFNETQLLSTTTGDNSLNAEAARLEGELARLRATYHENYPEVVAKKEELAAVRRRMAPDREIQRRRDALTAAEAKLSQIEKQDEPDPDVLASAEKNVEDARDALSQKITEASRASADITTIQLEGRIAVIDNRIRTFEKQITDTQKEIASLEERVAKTPEVERGLSALTRDYDNIFREYQDVLAKQQDAQLAENLEENQQAEKFSILEPALRPEQPSSPDRPKLIVFAIFVALAAGGAIAFTVEMLFATVRGRHHISHIIEGHPMAVIPYIHNEDDRRLKLPFSNRKKRIKAIMAEAV